jgi:hypothetical protein
MMLEVISVFLSVFLGLALALYIAYQLFQIIAISIFCRVYGVSYSEALRRLNEIKKRR